MTGAAGFIGGRLVDSPGRGRLPDHPGRASRAPPIDSRSAATVIDVIGDVGDRAIWDQVADADIVFHFAAQTSSAVAADESGRGFPRQRHADASPAGRVPAERRAVRSCCSRAPSRRRASPSRLPVNEDEPDDPITVYDRHKLMAEEDLKAAASQGVVRGATLRLANVYGPGAHGRAQRSRHPEPHDQAAMRGEPLTVYGTGEYVRDYVFVEDVVDAFLMAAVHPEQVNGRHFVVGSGRGITHSRRLRAGGGARRSG